MVMTEEQIWALLESVPDPEVPVLSVVDLGVVRGVSTSLRRTKQSDLSDSQEVTITITPTYSGCPAMDMISMGIRMALIEAGIKNVQIVQQLSPAWTTDWMSEAGKQKLKEYGIAPPLSNTIVDELFGEDHKIQCPQCNSMNTELVSQFGSTSCKALYRCLDCKEPFDYFKCHR
ncbi:MAG: 1,2-phenylacetyl-CoA epoxidase subunit PaaD [Bacteroidota bacterium]